MIQKSSIVGTMYMGIDLKSAHSENGGFSIAQKELRFDIPHFIFSFSNYNRDIETKGIDRDTCL